jgi:uncharacterized protein YlxP (DUF503 family)
MIVIGASKVVLDFYGNDLLSKKTSELRKLIKRVRTKYQVDIQEIDTFDDPEKCTLAFSMVGFDSKKLRRRMEAVARFIDEISFARVVSEDQEYFQYE